MNSKHLVPCLASALVSTRFNALRAPLRYWLPVVLVFALASPVAVFAAQYDLVRGKQFSLCRALVQSFNEFKDQPPMVCRRKLSTKHKTLLRMPPWKELDPEHNWPLVMAARKAFDTRRGGLSAEQLQAQLAQYESEARERARTGNLHLYEASFDLARSGESVRVVMVDDFCNPEDLKQFLAGPALAVLREKSLEPDARYRRIQGLRADIVLFEGLPYLASWNSFPSAVGRAPAPAKTHDGYILVSEPFWLENSVYKEGMAGFRSPVCQIGYKH